MNISTPFNFGDKVEHTLTGLIGVVVGVDVWKNGCVRICIQPREMKDGAPVNGAWIDEQDVSLIAPGDVPEAAPSGVRVSEKETLVSAGAGRLSVSR